MGKNRSEFPNLGEEALQMDQSANTTMEAVGAGAIVVASHRNTFTGLVFQDFLSAMLHELGIMTRRDAKVKFQEKVII